MSVVSRSCEHEGPESTHLIDGIYDSGRIVTPEIQCDFSSLPGIDEIGYPLVIGGSKVPRG